jgi:adenine phosphoribosyltransferase
MNMPDNSPQTFPITIGGKISRDLPIVTLPGTDTRIASFVMLGDTELNEVCAELLYGRVRQTLREQGKSFDLIIGTEAKSIALLQAMARLAGRERYVVLRKGVKNYMQDPLFADYTSITTAGEQRLVLDGPDAGRIRGKDLLLVDDVVSTGGTIAAARELVGRAGGRVVLSAAVLLENDEPPVPDLVYLERLPLPG